MIQIIPIKDLKDTARIAALCKQTSDPVFVTKNGYGELVLMSVETYERELAYNDIHRKLAVAEKQLAEGKLLEGSHVFDRLYKKYED